MLLKSSGQMIRTCSFYAKVTRHISLCSYFLCFYEVWLHLSHCLNFYIIKIMLL